MSENTTKSPAIIAPSSVAGDFKVELSAEILELRDDYVLAAGFVEQVTNPAEKQVALDAVAKLKGFANDLEKTRVAAKEPFLAAGRIIDAAAKSALKPVTPEIERIEAELGRYAQEQMKKEREERLARERAEQAERDRLARLQREQEEAERQAAEAARKAELARQQAEAAAAAAKNKKAREQAEAAAAEARRLAEQAEQAQRAAEQSQDANLHAQVEASEATPVAAPKADIKAAGASVRPQYEFEVTDILGLYEAWPEAVELVPRTGFIKTTINQPGAKHNIPGLAIREVVKVAVRGVGRGEANFLK